MNTFEFGGPAADALQLAIGNPASQQDGTHPRPQLRRGRHLLLDRQAGFAHDDELVGLDQHWERDPQPFQRRIQLPFAPETEASGICERGFQRTQAKQHSSSRIL